MYLTGSHSSWEKLRARSSLILVSSPSMYWMTTGVKCSRKDEWNAPSFIVAAEGEEGERRGREGERRGRGGGEDGERRGRGGERRGRGG